MVAGHRDFQRRECHLLQPLPYREPQELVLIQERIAKFVNHYMGVSAPDVLDFAGRNRTLEAVGAFLSRDMNALGRSEPLRVKAARVTAATFPLLGVSPQLGRTFTREEDQPGRLVTVLSYGLSQTAVRRGRPSRRVQIRARRPDLRRPGRHAQEFRIPATRPSVGRLAGGIMGADGVHEIRAECPSPTIFNMTVIGRLTRNLPCGSNRRHMLHWRVSAFPLIVRVLMVAAVIYGILYFFASRAPYYPQKYPGGYWDMQARLHADDVWLTTSDGVRIHGWFVPCPGAALVTLFLHGNAGNLTYRIGDFESIQAAGSSLLMIDYRGYGRSSGWPTERGLYRDADAAYDYLLQRGYSPQHIVVHGESLGTAVAVELALRQPCAGLVLEAPLTSAHELAGTVLPLIGPLLIWNFDTLGRIRRIHAPVLIIHGDRDEIIPQRMGKAVYAAALGPKWFWSVPGAGHHDLLDTAGAEYTRRLRDFYATLH